MADKKFDLVFNASLEVGQVKSAVASLTKSLENAGAKIPQSMTSNLNRMIQSLSTELNKLEGMTDIQLDPKNAKNVGKSYEKIFQTFQQIKVALGDIHRTAGIDPEKFFPSEIANNISKAAQAVQKYKKAMEAGIKTDEHIKATKDIADAEKKVKSLNDKLDEAARKRQSSSIVKDQLQETRKKLQAERDQAEAEDKAAKEAQKAIQDRIKSQERLAQVEEEIAKRKKKQQEAVNKAAKANEIKNERESMKQAKGKGTDTKIYRDAVASYAEGTAEVQRLQGEIDQLEVEYAQLSQAATVTADEIAAANDRATKATTELANAQKRLNKNQSDIDAADTKYTAATAEVKTLVPEVQKAEDALNQLIQKKEQLESSFEQSIFDELIQELEKLGIKLPDTERSMEGIERALDELANKAKGEVVSALQGVEKAVEDIETPLKQTGQAANNFDQMADSAKHAEQDMENLKNQVLDFFSITNTIQIFKNAIRDAFDTVKELDAAMTETAVVTDFSIGDMWDKLPQYSEEATKLGASIKSLYEATTLYYQQGLNSEQAMGVGIETMKMARIANMDAAAATEAMTAALRGFNMEINETSATRINDVYSELAAITAADTSQIATAMSKTASIAEAANMEFETTAALLAQIIETTQEAPETAGTAMKTIIARFTEVKQLFSEGMLTGEDSEGEEIDINKIDAALKTVGISLKDFLNGSKGIDDIFLELASKWDTLDLATQRYIATTAAGSRQQSRFLAMMGNYDRTIELVNAATNSAGASQKQFGKTLESMEAKLQKLKNAWDTFTMGLANNELIKFGVDLLTKLLETVNNLTDDLGDAVGGIAKLALALGGLKAGKNVFNAIFDLGPLEQKVGKLNNISGILAKSLHKAAGTEATALSESLKVATDRTHALTNGFTMLGVGCGLLAQYFRSLGLEELATGLEITGSAIVVVSSGINALNSIAVAAGTNIAGLFDLIKAAALKAVSAIGAFLAPLGLWIIPIVVAVGALVALFVKMYQNSPVGQLKAAQKASEEAAKAAQEAADAYNNLNSALSSIDSKTAALNNMTKGTQEWRNAVIELNEEMMSLIEQYPELTGFLTNDGGVLKLDYDKKIKNQYGTEQTVDDVLKSYSQRATETQQISYQKKIEEEKAEINVEFDKKAKDALGVLTITDLEKLNGTDSSAWDDSRKAIDEIAVAIANGEVQNNEADIRKWMSEKTPFQIMDFEEVDYFALQEYGNYLISQQAVMEGLTDATIAAQMALMDFSTSSEKTQTVMGDLDTNILRASYEQTKTDNVLKKEDVTAEHRDRYAESLGYTKGTNFWGKTIYKDKDGKTQKIDDQKVAEYISNQKTNQGLEDTLSGLAKHLDSSERTEEQLDMFSEVFTEGAKELSLSTLQHFADYQNGEFGFNSSNQEDFAKSMGFNNFEEMAKAFNVGADEFTQQLNEIFAVGGKEFIEVRKNLVKNMSKFSTGTAKDFDVNANLLNLLEAKYKNFDVSGILTDVINKLELTGDEEFSTAAYESFRDIMMEANGAAEMEDALHFFETLDFSNPINALDTINNEIENGTGRSRELAIAMKEANSSFLSASSQMSTLFGSAEFDDIKEDLDDIIEKNGEISAADVFDLTKSYKSLDKVLKNNKMTANGLAEILEQIADGTVKVDELTDTVLAAMSSFESLDSIAAKSVKFFEDFDLGIDESVVGDTIVEWGDLILENMKKGAVGNSQNFRILDTLFPGWDEGIETAEGRIAEMSRLGNLLKGNGQNLRKMWSDIASGKDFKGGAQTLSAENAAMGLTVRDTGEEIIFEGWEGKNLTSVDLVSWISDAYNVSTEMAEALLTDFKNYSGDLADELRANDYAAGIQEAYEALHQFGNLKLVDEREIETIAKLLGVDAGTIRQDLVDRGATVTDFYDDKGEIKSFDQIQGFMDAQSAGLEAGKKWSDAFTQSVEQGAQGTFEKSLDMAALEKELNKIGITGINAEKLKEQAFNAMKEGLGAGVASVKVNETLANGEKITIDVTPEMSYEEYQQQINKLTQQAENSALADAIGASVAEAMNNIEITTQINENSLIEFRTQIEEAASQAQPEANVTLSEGSANTMRSNITEIAEEPHTSPVTISINNPNAINNLMGRKTVYVDIVVGNNGLSTATSGYSSNDVSTTWTSANGLKNAPKDGTSLVSEEGPELVQKAEGGAYLTGQNGPEIINVNKGDTIYTAEETESILKKRSHNEFPRYASGYGSGTAYWGTGSGGKGSGDSDDEDWENPFDKLYNLVREIDEELRRRERLERRYEKLLESVDLTAGKLFDNAVEQLKQLEKEKLLNKELQEVRRSQIQQYQQENADLMKYAKVVQNERGEDVLRIHWDQIDLVENPEQGQRIEDYVSQLEEWFDSLEEAEDKLNDIEDRIEEVKELGKEEYLDFENAVKDAITFAYQEEIDKLSEINESINDTNAQLIDAISKQVNRMRQQRENERTEQELQEKQRQLLYLSQDTSGANDMAILELQREIEERAVDYTDTLIDQKIDELQTQNDEAAQQREQQITLMQAQLDHLIQSGEIWDEVYSLMDEGLDPEAGLIRGSRLEQILKSAENFNGMSKVQQMDWLKELQQQTAQAVVYMRLTSEKIDTAIELNRQDYFGPTTPEPEYNGSSSGGSGGGGSSGGGGFSNTSQNNSTPKGYEITISASGGFPGGTYRGTTASTAQRVALDAIQGFQRTQALKISQMNIPKAQKDAKISSLTEIIKQLSAEAAAANATPYYLHGGLADFTGPAWLDGTKTRPELVLNAKDTQNFIQLKDILASLMTGSSHSSTENNGDITYDIDINVESIGSDYDVEQVANKVKSMINDNARYRNNNIVSLTR